jgi:hypothetical protein
MEVRSPTHRHFHYDGERVLCWHEMAVPQAQGLVMGKELGTAWQNNRRALPTG